MDISQRQRPKITATLIILVALLLVFIFETFDGGSENVATLLKFGAMNNVALAAGHQYWRLFTAQFLHIGWLHLAANAVMIYYMGTMLEKLVGPVRFLAVYLLAGVGGNLLSYALGNDFAVSAGASTALFGTFGAIIALYWRNSHNSLMSLIGRQSFTIAVANLFIDLFLTDVDIWGHVGGLVTGFLLMLMVGDEYMIQNKWLLRIIAAAGIILYTIFCLKQGLIISR